MTRIALVAGGWGQNIGNAFFNLGGRHLLEEAGGNVQVLQDDPSYWTFRNQRRGAYKNAFDLIAALEIDLLVLQGPLFTETFPHIWRERLRSFRAMGTRWAVISGAFRKYTGAEVSAITDVFKVNRPEFVITRDVLSAEMLRSRGITAWTGIDSAFFISDVVPAVQLRRSHPAIVTFCFDHFSEPDLIKDEHGSIRLGGVRYRPSVRRVAEAAARRGKAWSYVYRPFDRRQLPSDIGGTTIVRPEHRTNPHIPIKIYQQPNGIASDEPWTYLSLYSVTDLTFTDRVHACVATLAYGRPAMLYNPTTRRSELFAAVGVPEIQDRPVVVERLHLENLKRSVVARVRSEIAGG